MDTALEIGVLIVNNQMWSLTVLDLQSGELLKQASNKTYKRIIVLNFDKYHLRDKQAVEIKKEKS